MKSTPGPWRYKADKIYGHAVLSGKEPNHKFVAYHLKEDNARLIAKAPEMLELLKRWTTLSKAQFPGILENTEKLLKELEQ